MHNRKGYYKLVLAVLLGAVAEQDERHCLGAHNDRSRTATFARRWLADNDPHKYGFVWWARFSKRSTTWWRKLLPREAQLCHKRMEVRER